MNQEAPENKETTISQWDRFLCFLSVGLGIGYLPKAPGTWGSLLGPLLIVATGANTGNQTLSIILGLVTFVIGIPICNAGIKVLKRGDPSQVVFDEIVAFYWVFLFVPFDLVSVRGWLIAAAGFALFRLFDILKPWPVSRAERLHGGLGVMADDTVAGMLAGLLLSVIVNSGIWN